MSKKIVIELSENLAEIIRWFLKAKCPFSSKEVVKQITQQLESKVVRSVIEWHDWGSIPEAESTILVKFKERIEIDVVHYENDWWHLGNGTPESAIAWAYLPKGGEE